jgi:hypothetical protein
MMTTRAYRSFVVALSATFQTVRLGLFVGVTDTLRYVARHRDRTPAPGGVLRAHSETELSLVALRA